MPREGWGGYGSTLGGVDSLSRYVREGGVLIAFGSATRFAPGVRIAQIDIDARESTANPIVADVDGDGASEIVVVSSAPVGSTGLDGPTLTVLQNIDDRFAPSRRIWNQHTYHHSNIHEDGRVPRHEAPHWDRSNSFRSNRSLSEQALCMPPVLSDGA